MSELPRVAVQFLWIGKSLDPENGDKGIFEMVDEGGDPKTDPYDDISDPTMKFRLKRKNKTSYLSNLAG